MPSIGARYRVPLARPDRSIVCRRRSALTPMFAGYVRRRALHDGWLAGALVRLRFQRAIDAEERLSAGLIW